MISKNQATISKNHGLSSEGKNVAEPPNLMSPRSARLPLDTKHPKEDTKLLGSVGHTQGENPKIHIFHQDHERENKTYIIVNYFLHHFTCTSEYNIYYYNSEM